MEARREVLAGAARCGQLAQLSPAQARPARRASERVSERPAGRKRLIRVVSPFARAFRAKASGQQSKMKQTIMMEPFSKRAELFFFGRPNRSGWPFFWRRRRRRIQNGAAADKEPKSGRFLHSPLWAADRLSWLTFAASWILVGSCCCSKRQFEQQKQPVQSRECPN